MSDLDEQLAPELQQVFGQGPVTTAWILMVFSYPGPVHSEAAFAALAVVSPLQASSGKHERYRLNRRGDRQFDKTLNEVARTRTGHTDYVDERFAGAASPHESLCVFHK
ncbi:transposase [Glutamicibacter sp. NPDC090743]|uniref:transposase n=1 Tax=Glutamicibacter sp. NPDC090743 TaxID=3364001 RepID=UPI0037FD27CB